MLKSLRLDIIPYGSIGIDIIYKPPKQIPCGSQSWHGKCLKNEGFFMGKIILKIAGFALAMFEYQVVKILGMFGYWNVFTLMAQLTVINGVITPIIKALYHYKPIYCKANCRKN
jgi:hypothetical protein